MSRSFSKLTTGNLEFNFRRGGRFSFLISTASTPDLGHALPSIQWVPGFLSLGIKRYQRDDNHSLYRETKVMTSYTSARWPNGHVGCNGNILSEGGKDVQDVTGLINLN